MDYQPTNQPTANASVDLGYFWSTENDTVYGIE